MNLTCNVQPFNYLFVLDFAVTLIVPQEIIEIACLQMSTQTMQVMDCFRQFVRPQVKPKLNDWTIEVTEVEQKTVDSAPYFNEAWRKFMNWHKVKKGNKKAAFVTIDNFPIKEHLRAQSLLSKTNISDELSRWINLKRVYFKAYNFFPGTLAFMMKELKLPYQGQVENAWDDVTNAALVAQRMLRANVIFEINNDIQPYIGVWPDDRPDWKKYVPPNTLPPDA